MKYRNVLCIQVGCQTACPSGLHGDSCLISFAESSAELRLSKSVYKLLHQEKSQRNLRSSLKGNYIYYIK